MNNKNANEFINFLTKLGIDPRDIKVINSEQLAKPMPVGKLSKPSAQKSTQNILDVESLSTEDLEALIQVFKVEKETRDLAKKRAAEKVSVLVWYGPQSPIYRIEKDGAFYRIVKGKLVDAEVPAMKAAYSFKADTLTAACDYIITHSK